MKDSGLGACVMEVSSHSLVMKRVHGMRFAVAAFTNLTREHLDFHHDMQSYFEAKATLFTTLQPGASAVINISDDYGRKLVARVPPHARTVTFGDARDATIRMTSLELDPRGIRMTLESHEGPVTLSSPLVGRPNAFNITASAAVAWSLGIGWDAIARGVASATNVPGRMEQVGEQDFSVIVDYAHKEEALRSLLETVRAFTAGRVITVFGCGGDRDRTKRPIMGRHAATLSDLVWVTSDNPRSEKPMSIIDEILAGIDESARSSGRIQVEPDRKKAIEAAIGAAKAQDTVVIAGKGHETQQIIGDRVTPFDDRAVAHMVLERLRDDESADGGR
jgi:UDP-N-acetylmuramoyl-L-alanyl-D-glutamate--2,6-diaminopimelate ligase